MGKNPMDSRPDEAAEDDSAFIGAWQRFIGEVFRLNSALLATADRVAEDTPVTTSEWRAIASIQYGFPRTMPQIARRVGISRQAIRKTVRKLEAKGYVRLDDNPDHQRSQLVSLTPQGRRLMDDLLPKQSLLTHMFTDGLGLDVHTIKNLADQIQALRIHAEALGVNAGHKVGKK